MAGADAQLLHALMLVVWVPALLAWRALDRAWARNEPALLAVTGVVTATYVAGLAHVVALPEHARESPLYGAFFAAAALAQHVYVVVLSRHPTHRLLEWGVLVQLGLVVVWAASRTVGMPVGPAAGQPEPVAFLDLACVTCEVAAVLLSLHLLSRRPSAVAVP